MRVYLVGGAVRDQLLGLPVHERDWVVVGGNANMLLAQGYQQVGKDFPVFLHPQTREEYALARKERKQSPGYHGFDCEVGEHVTLEEDLSRRDLTINAMAMDELGQLIDPYQGVHDLKEKKLRHVSDAFIEDPVRVLRIARFAARFHHLGFRVDEKTRYLMYLMMQRGELAHLVAERVWQEWQKSLLEKNPERFIEVLRDCGALNVILPEIHGLFGIPNTCTYHPEIDSGIHTLMVLMQACQLSSSPVVRFAALLHDLGKALTPKTQWPSHHGHEERGVKVIEALCTRLKIPSDYRHMAIMASRYHLLIHRLYELKPSTIVKILEQVDAFRRPQLFEQLLLVCEADAKGRMITCDYPQANHWREVYQVCAKIVAKQVIEKGYKGSEIKQQLHQLKAFAIEPLVHSWKKQHEK